jgi:hypothetical protein
MRSDLTHVVDKLSNALPRMVNNSSTTTDTSSTNHAGTDYTANKLTTAAYTEIKHYLDEHYKGWQSQNNNNVPRKLLDKQTGSITWVCDEHRHSPQPLTEITESKSSATYAASLLELRGADQTRCDIIMLLISFLTMNFKIRDDA